MTWGMFVLAVVLALDIFAGAISLGLQGLPRRQWARTAMLFATTTSGIWYRAATRKTCSFTGQASASR